MSIVNLSLDTNTREVVLTINGVLVTTNDVLIEKYEFDDEKFVRFQYTIESTNSDGMKERRSFFLPDPTEVAVVAELNEDGLASKICFDDTKVKADIVDYINKTRH